MLCVHPPPAQVLNDSEEDSQHPAAFQATSVRGCTGGASRQDGHKEESSAGGPWWATGDWLLTGSRLTGLRSLETGRSPVESKRKKKKQCGLKKKKKSKSEFVD